MRPSKIPRDLFIISILTLITVLTWIAFDAYRVLQKEDVPKILQKQIEPINPDLDTKILDDLSGRIQIEKDTLTAPHSTSAAGP